MKRYETNIKRYDNIINNKKYMKKSLNNKMKI